MGEKGESDNNTLYIKPKSTISEKFEVYVQTSCFQKQMVK